MASKVYFADFRALCDTVTQLVRKEKVLSSRFFYGDAKQAIRAMEGEKHIKLQEESLLTDCHRGVLLESKTELPFLWLGTVENA